MQTPKLRDWLQKLTTIRLQKPSQIAKLNKQRKQLEDLIQGSREVMAAVEGRVAALEGQVGGRVSGLGQIEGRNRDGWYQLRKYVDRLKDNQSVNTNLQLNSIKQIKQLIQKKQKTLCQQLKTKNQKYIQTLTSQLESLKQLRQHNQIQRQSTIRQYQQHLTKNLKKAEQLIQSQQKDLQLIQQFQNQLLKRCDQVERGYEQQLEAIVQGSEHRRRVLFRGIEGLIAEVDVE